MSSITESVSSELRKKISTGALAGGARVSETALAKEFGTSRAPVREVIKDLVNEGFLEQVAGVGSFVKVPDRNDLIDLFEVREWLECGAIGKAAMWGEAKDVDDLQNTIDDLAALVREYRSQDNWTEGDYENWRERVAEVELSFHMRFLHMAGNHHAIEMLQKKRVLQNTWFSSVVATLGHESETTEQSVEEHQSILDAIRARDKDAAQEKLREHIQKRFQFISEAFDRRNRQLALEKRSK